MLELMLPEWRKEMDEVYFTITDVAKRAGVGVSTATAIVTGDQENPGVQTVGKLRAAMKELRGICPMCGQQMPHRESDNVTVRRLRAKARSAKA